MSHRFIVVLCIALVTMPSSARAGSERPSPAGNAGVYAHKLANTGEDGRQLLFSKDQGKTFHRVTWLPVGEFRRPSVLWAEWSPSHRFLAVMITNDPTEEPSVTADYCMVDASRTLGVLDAAHLTMYWIDGWQAGSNSFKKTGNAEDVSRPVWLKGDVLSYRYHYWANHAPEGVFAAKKTVDSALLSKYVPDHSPALAFFGDAFIGAAKHYAEYDQHKLDTLCSQFSAVDRTKLHGVLAKNHSGIARGEIMLFASAKAGVPSELQIVWRTDAGTDRVISIVPMSSKAGFKVARIEDVEVTDTD